MTNPATASVDSAANLTPITALPDGTTGKAIDKLIARTHRSDHPEICAQAGLPPDRPALLLGLRTACLLTPGEPPRRFTELRRRPMPTAGTQLANATRAAARLAGAATTGKQVTVSPEELANRRATCAACEHYDSERNRCAQCGCRLSAKQRLATERCPEGEW